MRLRDKSARLFICVIFVISLISTSVSTSTFASELNNNQLPFILTQDSDIPNVALSTTYGRDYLTDEEYNAVLEDIRLKAQAAITPQLIEKVKKIRTELVKNNIISNVVPNVAPNGVVTPLATYDSVSLETILDLNDGLSVIDIFKIGVTHANAARDEAIELYEDTSTEMKRDAFRHMTWNFRSIIDVGEHKTRVATINHEWAYLILPEVNRYELERFDYYYDQYRLLILLGLMSTTDIWSYAKADADAYAITYRDQLIASCKNSLAVFNSTFSSNAYIMDFWNNKIGRDYGKSHPTSTTDSVFTTAWNANQLIKNESSAVTSTVRSTLHSTNWWYIW